MSSLQARYEGECHEGQFRRGNSDLGEIDAFADVSERFSRCLFTGLEVVEKCDKRGGNSESVLSVVAPIVGGLCPVCSR